MSGWDREEVMAAAMRGQRAPKNGNRVTLQQLQQAQVEADKLTGDPHWDLFLSYVAAAAERAEQAAENIKSLILQPNMVGHDELMMAKIELAEAEAQARAWRQVIALPADIRESGEQAKTLLERMDEPEN